MSSLSPQPAAFNLATDRDILAELLADKRSVNTRRAYAKDLKDFFLAVTAQEPDPTLVAQFLQLDRFSAIALVLQYKAQLIDKELKEATINRRLAAIKSLVNFARKVGKCEWSLEDVKGEKIQAYRDTTGINADTFKRILAIPDCSTLKGKRDYAILRLLWECCLRRAEVSQCNVKDLDLESNRLWILGKGKGSQKTAISLSSKTVAALQDWLLERTDVKSDRSSPLFISLDRASYGHRLSTTSIYKLVDAAAVAAGITKKLSPHRIRHSGITAALDATGGDVRRVQKLSRHAKLDTLMIYDDNRSDRQGEITELLSGMI